MRKSIITRGEKRRSFLTVLYPEGRDRHRAKGEKISVLSGEKERKKGWREELYTVYLHAENSPTEATKSSAIFSAMEERKNQYTITQTREE